MALGDVIARLSVALSLDSAAFSKGSKEVQTSAEKLRGGMMKVGAAIAGALAVDAIIGFAQQWKNATIAALEAAGSLGETAQQLGVTTDALQEYRFAATQAGVEQGQMDKALGQLTKRMGEAAQGSKGPTEAFKLLGISLAELKGKSTGDVLPLIAEGLKGVSSESERAAILVDLFGKSGQLLLPMLSQGADGVNSLRQAAHDAGIVISEELIVSADGAADKLAALYAIVEAKKNVAMLDPDNVKAVMAYEQSIADLQLTFYKAIGSFAIWANENKKWETDVKPFILGIGTWMQTSSKQVGTFVSDIMTSIGEMVMYVPNKIGEMVRAISGWLQTRLGAVWKTVTDKVDQVKAAFHGLYMSVVGGSDVPDMVLGIAGWMAKLDAAMVAPVTAATGKATKAFREMAGEVKGILDRLFPETASNMQYEAERALISRSLSGEAQYQALNALAREKGDENYRNRQSGGIDVDMSADPLDQMGEGVDNFTRRMQELGERASDTGQRVAKSFKQMADDTLSSLNRLTSAIKGGGFLSILEAVIGFGIQLGSVGAFGSKISGRLNKTVPGYALGTGSARRGMALVGEDGPELVRFRGGEKVFSNRNSRSMMGGGTTVNHFSGNLLTPEFWAMIQAGDIQAAHAGAQGGVSKMQYRQMRRWR